MQRVIFYGAVKKEFYHFSDWHQFRITHVECLLLNYLPAFFQLRQNRTFNFFSHSKVLLLFHISGVDDFLQLEWHLVLNNEGPKSYLLITAKQFNELDFLFPSEPRKFELPKVLDLAEGIDKVVELNVQLYRICKFPLNT